MSRANDPRIPHEHRPPATALLVVAPRGWSEACGLAALAGEHELRVIALEELAAGDRAAVAQLDGLVAALGGARRRAVLGIGPGSALALLLACTSNGIAACALVGGALVLPRLSAQRPMQPLELALNLACPLHVFHGAEDPDFPPAHVALARAKLAQFARAAEFHALAGAGSGWCDPAHPGYRPAPVRAALERALAALARDDDAN